MFEPLEIIYASPLLMKVAFTAGLVAAVAFAATFLTMAIMDLRGGSRRSRIDGAAGDEAA